MHQLQQRLASGSQASSSSRCQPTPCKRYCLPAVSASVTAASNRRRQWAHLCRAVEADEFEELEIDERNDTVYDRVVEMTNLYPDYDDPDWISKVKDWNEFWYESEDILGLDDEHDSGVAGRAAIDRASMRKNPSVEQIVTSRFDVQPMHRLDPNPTWNVMDFRAMAEKRRQKAILDAEWQRQHALLARPTSFTLRYYCDARLESCEFDWVRETWTHEQIMDLIVGGGKYVHPDDVKAVTTLNPLMGADYHNDYGVTAVPETEDYIRGLGHMATEDEILHLNAGLELSEEDFADPAAVFEDAANAKMYMDAPINVWAQERKARDAADVDLFVATLEKVQQRQQRKEALAAAAAAEGGSEAAESSGAAAEAAAAPMDEIMGEGFTEFMNEGVGGVVFYDEDAEVEDEDEYDGEDEDEEVGEEEEGEEGGS
eukprot:gene4394-4647_t